MWCVGVRGGAWVAERVSMLHRGERVIGGGRAEYTLEGVEVGLWDEWSFCGLGWVPMSTGVYPSLWALLASAPRSRSTASASVWPL